VPRLQTGAALVYLTTSVVVTLFLTIVLYQIVFLDRIFLGVGAMDVDLGGLTRAQAHAVIAGQANRYLSLPITLQYGDRHWTLTARQAGATLDTAQMADQAYAIGRHSSLLTNLRQQWWALRHGIHIGLTSRYDSGPANSRLSEIAQSVDRPARDARLIIHHDLSAEAIPAQVGLAVDVDATRQAMHRLALTGNPDPIELVVRETPHAADQAGEWVLTPSQLADMIAITEEVDADGVGRVRLRFDVDRTSAYLSGLAAQIERLPVDARFEVNPDSGDVTVLQPSRMGLRLDVHAALAAASELLANPTHHAQLPVVVIPPAVPMDAVSTMDFTNLITQATTHFEGSPEARVRNIQAAASRFHGIVVPPGAVFSFNEYLGPVTTENGFEDSLIIWGDRTAVGIGGGVCQVSTTAFRAAFFAGYQIVERWAHGYRVGWYETDVGPGLDATIYAPDVDFRFRNDTDHYLLIQTDTDPEAATITFGFYGAPLNRTVTMEGPIEENVVSPQPPLYEDDRTLPEGTTQQVEWEKDGVDVTVRRTVTEDGVVVQDDIFVSRYQPWRAVYLTGTGEGQE
jgi:vancomycin resistance protein YoaR